MCLSSGAFNPRCVHVLHGKSVVVGWRGCNGVHATHIGQHALLLCSLFPINSEKYNEDWCRFAAPKTTELRVCFFILQSKVHQRRLAPMNSNRAGVWNWTPGTHGCRNRSNGPGPGCLPDLGQATERINWYSTLEDTIVKVSGSMGSSNVVLLRRFYKTGTKTTPRTRAGMMFLGRGLIPSTHFLWLYSILLVL